MRGIRIIYGATGLSIIASVIYWAFIGTRPGRSAGIIIRADGEPYLFWTGEIVMLFVGGIFLWQSIRKDKQSAAMK